MSLPVRRGNWPMRRPSQLAAWDPMRDLDFENLWDQMRQFFEAPRTLGGDGTWMPLTEEDETDEEYTVRAELPGIPKEKISIDLDENELRIAGEIKEEEEKPLSRRSGRFIYRTRLPRGIDTDGAKAEMDQGILTVRVPKTSEQKRRKVEISR
jgi:HSP20 family protein